MADRWAVANGNWSNTATWNGGTLPTAVDDVFADGFTVTIDQNVTVLSVRTTQRSGGTAGGNFYLNTGFTLNANVIAGTTRCVIFSSASPGSATIVGDLTAGTSVNAYGASNDSTGTLTIIGNCTGGSNTNTSASWNVGGGIINITGNCTGGTSSGGSAARNLGTSTTTITGNCIGGLAGAGAANSNTGTITVIGSAIGGIAGAAFGVTNESTGIVNVIRAVGNGFGLGSVGLVSLPGVFSAQSSITNVQEIEYGDLGQSPTSGPISLTDLTSNKAIFYRPSLTKKTLVDQAASGGMPSASNVRSGTSFNFGNTTGTLAVPATNQVAVGVPVDNTVGTAVLTVANVQSILNASMIRREVERVNGIRDWGVVNDAPLIVPSTGDSNLASFPGVVKIGSDFHCFYSAGNGSIRHVSLGTDGRTVGSTRTTVVTPGAGAVEDAYIYSPIVAIEGTTLKMWYTGQSSTLQRSSIFYATASTSDPLTWTKQGVVIPHTLPPSWVRNCPGGTGMKKVGSTYYLYGTSDLIAAALDASNVNPKNYSDRRAWVATSLNGTSGWTFYPILSNTENPSYVDEYMHLISATSFSYTVNSELRHYLLASKRGAGSDYQQLVLFESCDPLFPRNATEELGTVLLCRSFGETFPTSEIDIFSVVTSDITGFVPGEFLMYFGGRSKDAAESRWSIGLSSQPNVLQAIRPPYRSQQNYQPNLMRELVERNVNGELKLKVESSIIAIKDKTDLISAGQVQIVSPVGAGGNITTPIFIGDDYKASNGRAFKWTIDARTGFSASTATCRFGGASEETGDSWNVTGTVTDIGGGEWELSFDLTKAVTATLSPGFYRWSVELRNPSDDEVTEVYNSTANRQAEVRAKQT